MEKKQLQSFLKNPLCSVCTLQRKRIHPKIDFKNHPNLLYVQCCYKKNCTYSASPVIHFDCTFEDGGVLVLVQAVLLPVEDDGVLVQAVLLSVEDDGVLVQAVFLPVEDGGALVLVQAVLQPAEDDGVLVQAVLLPVEYGGVLVLVQAGCVPQGGRVGSPAKRYSGIFGFN